MKRLGIWILAALAGSVLLLVLAPRVHPAALWKVACDRQESQVRAREISAVFGVDTAGWTAVVTGDTDSKAGYVRAPRFSAIYSKVVLAPPSGPARILVSLSAAGDIGYWEWKGYPKASPIAEAAARAIAAGAFTRILGKDAAAFQAVPDVGKSDGNLVFACERPAPQAARLEATVSGSRLIKAELTAQYGADVTNALSSRKKYRNWLASAVGMAVYSLGTLLALGVYVFWAARHLVRHRFVFSISALAILWGAVYWLNWMGYDQRYDSLTKGESLAENFFGGVMILAFLILFYIVLAGATDAIGPRPKLLTLRSVFSASWFNRDAGFSSLAGILWSPLLAALPLAVSTLHLFGSQQTGDYDASVIFAGRPAIQAMDVMLNTALLGVFGFLSAFLSRYIRKVWLSTAILALVGVLIFAVIALPNETAPASFLLSGALLFAAYYYLFLRIDLLAVLVAGWCAQVIWNGCILALQPAASLRSSGIVVFAALGGFAVCAAIVAWRAGELALDDSAAPAALTSQRESLMKEFSIAHRVQQRMLPQQPPEIPGCTVAASCHPAQEVGGDLFDFLPLPDGRWSIGVGDVSGKGVPAALYMTLTKGLLVATTQDSSDLLEIIGSVNGHIHAATERKTFVTMALGAFDPGTRQFDHVRAGHNPIVWRSAAAGSTSLLKPPGLGLGIVSDGIFRRAVRLERLQLGSGDALVFYSDGLTEAMNESKEQFGEDRLMQVVEDADGLDAGRVRERILESVTQFLDGVAPQDDMTIVVLRVN